MPESSTSRSRLLVHDAFFVAEARSLEALPPPILAQIAFAGRSNVGKSSLINTLVMRKKLVRTSQTPGCTRGINFFRARIDDAELDLVDLPGYGYAQRSKAERRLWGSLIEQFLSDRPGLRAVVVIVDCRRGLDEEEHGLLELLASLDRPAVVVATKIDKVPSSRRKSVVAKIEKDAGQRVFAFSATTGEGREALLRRLLSLSAIEIDASSKD